jgi:spermidine synthase
MRKVLLLAVAFLSGAILMALEIIGSRVLAPEFGGSIFVWGSLIGVFLAALSLGYYIGGKMADRWPSARLLAGLLFASGLFVLLLPRFGSPVCAAVAERDYGPRANPLLACTVLFLIPGVLMGATSPFVIRLTAKSIKQVGQTAGAVYAFSTLGSIAGTLGTAFYMINLMGTKKSLISLGIALIFTAFIAALARSRRGAAKIVAALALCALFAASQPASAAERTIVERDSPYQHLFVTEKGGCRYLRTNNVWHSQMRLNDPHGRGFEYTDYIDIALLFNPEIREVLIIGLGGGSIPKRLVRDYPNLKVDVVEIDPEVIRLAEKYFYVRSGPRLAIHESDGRIFLRRSKKKYDLIMLDAYYADTVPFFLATQEFFSIIYDHLAPNGILVNNVIGAISGPKSKFFRSIYRTTSKVFPQVRVFRVPEPGAIYINIEIFALKSRNSIAIETLRERLEAADCAVKNRILVRRLLGDYYGNPVPTDDVPLLTDDYAPVDALIHLW